MKARIKDYLIRLQESCWMRKLRVALVILSPLVIWGPGPVRMRLHLVFFAHFSAWVYGVFSPNSRLFGSIFRRGDRRRRWVALTFDDGPSESYSPQILDTLRRHGIKATFFIVGAQAEAHEDLVRRIWQEGHAIGNHTWSHPAHLAFEGVMDRRRVREEIERGEAAIEAITGEKPKIFRPPQGFKNHLILETCREKGITLVGYTTRLPYHANGHPSSSLVEKVLRSCRPGSIVNFHDGWRTGSEWESKEMIGTLSQIIEGLKAKRYEFVTVQEMLSEAGEPK
jgi:peptidoglycan/xylan/chitin deacetylase (PgdA/CDA1 family)